MAEGPNGGPKSKAAEQIARRIEQHIIDIGWPDGTVLGSEAELLEQYDVSRAVFRESVRLLEHHFVARMRPGPGGGLVVTKPDTSAVRRAAALFLEYQKTSVADLFDTRDALELACVEMATDRLDEAKLAILRDRQRLEETAGYDLNEEGTSTCGLVLGADIDFHVLIAQLTDNSAMALFVGILTSLVAERAAPFTSRMPRARQLASSEASRREHSAIIEAAISGDRSLARHRALRHLENVREWMLSAQASQFVGSQRGRRGRSA